MPGPIELLLWPLGSNCAPMALNGLVTWVSVHFAANTCNRKREFAGSEIDLTTVLSTVRNKNSSMDY